MATEAGTPTALLPCESCGRDPEQAKRLHYLAACLDGHEVHVFDDICWLRQAVAHVWRDGDQVTYSATRFEFKEDETVVLTWLEDVHSGKVARHPKDQAAEIVYDDRRRP